LATSHALVAHPRLLQDGELHALPPVGLPHGRRLVMEVRPKDGIALAEGGNDGPADDLRALGLLHKGGSQDLRIPSPGLHVPSDNFAPTGMSRAATMPWMHFVVSNWDHRIGSPACKGTRTRWLTM
jgi:hypothetical protein